jgi:hypothetical protein
MTKTQMIARRAAELNLPVFTNGFAFADAELAAESNAVVSHLRRYTLRQFGPRCSEFESGCAVCEMWKKHDDLKSYICD